jgi:hypothetical protein
MTGKSAEGCPESRREWDAGRPTVPDSAPEPPTRSRPLAADIRPTSAGLPAEPGWHHDTRRPLRAAHFVFFEGDERTHDA